MTFRCWLLLLVVAFVVWGVTALANNTVEDQTCTLEDDGQQQYCSSSSGEERPSLSSSLPLLQRDPNLKPMTVNLGGGDGEDDEESTTTSTTFYAYVAPDIATFYNKTTIGSVKAVEPKFTGQFGKFINLSNKKIQVYWQPTTGGASRTPTYIADVAPFGAAGTATYPGHQFLVIDPTTSTTSTTGELNAGNALTVWTIRKGQSLYSYDPYSSNNGSSFEEDASKVLTSSELELYQLQRKSLAFNQLYKYFTNREWLALYGRKYPPRYPMWSADYFGQTHTFTTNELQFESIPPQNIWKKVPWYGESDEERQYLQPYRANSTAGDAPATPSINMTMTVLSVSPRVFEIKNFLSQEECDHILELATGMKLSRSTTRAGSIASQSSSDDTRTSKNSWLSRQRSPIVDSIYRRTADLLQINEALLRYRKEINETKLVPETVEPISERLQLVHYAPGQQYTPHHVSFNKNLFFFMLP